MLPVKQYNHHLQQTLQQQETFSRVLLHDMRNPLAGIVLYTQLLQTRSELTSQQQHYLRLIQEETRQLRILLDQMQLLGKLQRGQQQLYRQLTDIPILLDEIATKHAAMAAKKEIELTHATSHIATPSIPVDRSLLQHLFEILVSHTLSFAPMHTAVTLAVTTALSPYLPIGYAATSPCPMLQVTITDQGPPLAATALTDIYERVEEWDLFAPERAGAGVSLALCKMIAEVHEGELAISSGASSGVTFTVELPVSNPCR